MRSSTAPRRLAPKSPERPPRGGWPRRSRSPRCDDGGTPGVGDSAEGPGTAPESDGLSRTSGGTMTNRRKRWYVGMRNSKNSCRSYFAASPASMPAIPASTDDTSRGTRRRRGFGCGGCRAGMESSRSKPRAYIRYFSGRWRSGALFHATHGQRERKDGFQAEGRGRLLSFCAMTKGRTRYTVKMNYNLYWKRLYQRTRISIQLFLNLNP